VTSRCKACLKKIVEWKRAHTESAKARFKRYLEGSKSLKKARKLSSRRALVRHFFKKTVFSYHRSAL